MLEAEGTLVDGELEGWWEQWWINGVKRAVGEYRRNKQEGPWLAWHSDGSRDRSGTGVYSDDRPSPGGASELLM